MGCIWVGSGLSFRTWGEVGRCKGSCLGWNFWFGWFPQSSSARTLRLVFGLCAIPVDAMLFLGSPRLTVCLCSLSLTFSVLFVSPTYTSRQSLQGTSYTTLVCFCSGILFLTCIRSLFRVFIGLKTGFTPRGHRPYQSSHLDPWCKECIRSWMLLPVAVWRLLGEVMSWLLGSSSLGFLGIQLEHLI